MTRRAVTFLVLAAIVAGGCVRLGFWQLHRLSDRRAVNARLASRLFLPPRPVRELVRDTAASVYRSATATGTYDFANEIALAARTREGSPGVNILTPLRAADGDTAVLVNRGWVYAADAMTVDFSRWTEPAAASVTGYLVEIPSSTRGGPVNAATNPRLVRRLQFDSLARRLPYPIAPLILVETETPAPLGTNTSRSRPARLPAPLMDEGPHLGYAIQWFSFAVIALVGAGVAIRADRRGSHRAMQRTRPTTQPREAPHG